MLSFLINITDKYAYPKITIKNVGDMISIYRFCFLPQICEKKFLCALQIFLSGNRNFIIIKSLKTSHNLHYTDDYYTT